MLSSGFLSGLLHALSAQEDGDDDARLVEPVAPCVPGATIYHRVAGRDQDLTIVGFEVHLTRDHVHVIDGIGAVPPGALCGEPLHETRERILDSVRRAQSRVLFQPHPALPA